MIKCSMSGERGTHGLCLGLPTKPGTAKDLTELELAPSRKDLPDLRWKQEAVQEGPSSPVHSLSCLEGVVQLASLCIQGSPPKAPGWLLLG